MTDNFARVLSEQADQQADRRAVRFRGEGEWTFADWYAVSSGYASRLAELCRPGDRTLILLAPGLDFVGAFLGCLQAGVIAVPGYPPFDVRAGRRLRAMVVDSDPAVVVTTSALRPLVQNGLGDIANQIRWFEVDGLAVEAVADRGPALAPARRGSDDIAFLQYTSGSTAMPKGTMVSHGNLWANSAAIKELFGHTRQSHGVVWLPPYHDMGLIGGILQPVYGGFPIDLMSPLDFLADPSLWVRAVSEVRGTTSGGPNFAFELCASRTPPEVRESLDLSSWTVAFSGGEPVRRASLAAFAETFARSGFRKGALYPCYGLAETTLIATGSPVGRGIVVRTGATETVVSSGSLVPSGHEVSIVEPGTWEILPDGQRGEICVAGPSVTHGYWRQPSATSAAFDEIAGERRVRTGDFGLICDGELYVTGRIKNTVIVRGRNHVAEDIEMALTDCHPALRPGGIAAFEIRDPAGQSALGLALELRMDPDQAPTGEIHDAVQTRLADVTGLRAERIHLLARGALPKTTSGKLQRGEARRMIDDGEIESLRLAGDDGQSPTTADEGASRLAALACELTGIPSVTVDAVLTTLGIDSLRAVQLRQAVRERMGLELDLVDILTGRSAEELVASARSVPAPSEAGELATEAVATTVSEGETGLWLASRLAGDDLNYIIRIGLDLAPDTDIDVLGEAISHLSRRHPALRSTFRDQNGRPERVVGHRPVRMEIVDASDVRSAVDALAELPSVGLNPVLGPVCRVRLIRTARGCSLDVTLHHIVSDVWSLDVLADELGVIYTQLMTGGVPNLPAAGDPAAVAVAEVERLRGPDGADLVARWRARLAELPPAARLPGTITRREAHSTSRRTELDLTSLAGSVRELAAQRGVTVFAVLQSSLAWALRAATSARRFTVGMLTAGRVDAGTPLVGYLANPVPLVCEVDDSVPFRDAVDRAARHAAEALVLQGLPVSRIARECAGGIRPRELISVLLVQQQAPRGAAIGLLRSGDGVVLGALRIDGAQVDRGTTPFDVTIEIVDDGETLTAALMHSEMTLESADAALFADLWRQVLGQLVSDPGRTWESLDLVPDDQIDRQVNTWNERTDYGYRPVPARILKHCREHPEVPAVHDRQTMVTFGELGRRARQIAVAVNEAGGGNDEPVALFLPRSADAVVAMCGIQLAGSPYLPLDPDHPAPRLKAIIEDARPTVIVTSREMSTRDAIVDSVPRVLLIEDLPAGDAETDRDAMLPGARPRPDHLSHVMYTSGSTGTPKGVACCHGGVANMVAAFIDRAGIRRGDRCGWWTSTGFDVSVQEIFSALVAGACVEVFPPPARLDPREYMAWVEDHGLNCVYAPPHVLPGMIARLERATGRSRLRSVLVGVEPIPEPLLRRLQAAVPGVKVINGYGPTESTVWSTWYDVPDDGVDDGIAPLGRAIPNGPVFVLDDDLRLVPVGAQGELYIGGAGTARGYLGRPAATAERFLPSPWGDGERIYRSGDQVRYRADGQLVFLGRNDGQAKVRGMRIEMREIEAAIAAHDLVADAIVVARREAPDTRLFGFARATDPATDRTALARALMTELRRRLPGPMVPQFLRVVTEWPMTVNGKIDRTRLDLSEPGPDSEASPPSDATERLVAEVWQELLGRSSIGRDTDFYEMGGDSLTATRVAAELSGRLDRVVEPCHVMDNPTVATLAKVVVQQPVREPDPDVSEALLAHVLSLTGGSSAVPDGEIGHDT